jgi:predicted nucleic acid-binding protein
VKLFLDANVLFTAAQHRSGKASFVIALAADGHWQLVTSSFAIEEAKRNLQIKFPEAIEALDRLLVSIDEVPTVLDEECPIDVPDKDVPIFLSAASAGCSHLLTGDLRHFGPFMNDPKRTSGVLIQTVGEFLSSL